MRAVPLLALALLAAGCAEPAPAAPARVEVVFEDAPAAPTATPEPAPRPEARVRERVALEVRAADGIFLRGHAYLPAVDAPLATVLAFGPYWGSEFPATGEMARDDGSLRPVYADETLARLAAAGFAIALFNVRGTGASDGCYRFFDPRDGADAAAIIEALAEAPWASGAVGMYGVSYDGWTQYAAMRERPEALRTTVPVSGVLDLWSVSTRNGAMFRTYVGAGVGYTGLYALDAASAISGGAPPSLPAPDTSRICQGGAEDTLRVDLVALDGDRTPALRARDLRDGVSASGIPALATYGLARPQMPDERGRARPFEGLVMNAQALSRILPEGSRVLVGAWGHGPPPLESFSDDVVRWMDEHLRGGPPTAWPAARYQDDEGRWHDASSWPPPARPLALELDPGQSLVSSERPTSMTACGPDHAVSAWGPHDEELLLAGAFTLRADIVSTANDGNLAASLFAFHGDDLCTADASREIARAHTDLRHRGHLDVGRPFPVGAAEEVRVESAPFAARVPAGWRLALVVGGGDLLELVPKAQKPALLIERGELTLPLA